MQNPPDNTGGWLTYLRMQEQQFDKRSQPLACNYITVRCYREPGDCVSGFGAAPC